MDTQEVANQLQKAGFEKEEALHMLHALDETMKDVATSQDIKRLESRIDAMQWTIGVGFTLLGVLMVALRLFA